MPEFASGIPFLLADVQPERLFREKLRGGD